MSKYFYVETDKPAISYKSGEKITFKITARENRNGIPCDSFKWELKGDDGKTSEGTGNCGFNPCYLETSCDRPGYVHLILTALKSDGEPDNTFDICDAGAGVDVDKIRRHGDIPADYDEYWNGIEELVENFDMKVIKFTPYRTPDMPEDYECYEFFVSAPCEMPAAGYITQPKGDGKYELNVEYQGYSPQGVYKPSFRKNTVRMVVNAHGIENGFTAEACLEKYPYLRDYGFNREENAKPETCYWQDMIIRDLIGLKFAKTLDKWDGKNILLTGGSQGAFQATAVAAHSTGVSLLEIGIPWFCDLRAEDDGYMMGWRPHSDDGLDYFDTAVSMTRVKCPVKITAFLGDYCCPPATVTALYNNCNTLKYIELIQSGTHGYRPPEKIICRMWNDPENPSGEIKGDYTDKDGNKITVTGKISSPDGEPIILYKTADGKTASEYEYRWNDIILTGGCYRRRFIKN